MAVGQGSGFVWDRNGHIVTNYHVIKGAAEVKVGGGLTPCSVCTRPCLDSQSANAGIRIALECRSVVMYCRSVTEPSAIVSISELEADS